MTSLIVADLFLLPHYYFYVSYARPDRPVKEFLGLCLDFYYHNILAPLSFDRVWAPWCA